MAKKDDIILLAKELLAIPSVSRDVEPALAIVEIVKKHLKDFSFTPFVSNQLPSLLYSNKDSNQRKFTIILNGHLDVVAAAKDHFQPYVKDDKLYGRGAFDMKGAIAVKILLFKELADKLSYPFALQLTCDEEISGADGTGYQVDQGVRGEFVIIGECNNNFQICTKSKGRQIIKLTTEGVASHSGYPWLGKNAIMRMYEVLEPILKAFPVAKKETHNTVVNLTKIESSENGSLNKIPHHCSAYIDIRSAPHDKETIAKIKSLLPPDIMIEIDNKRINHFVEPTNKYVLDLKKITHEIRREDYLLRMGHATSDAPFYTQIGCDAVEFGPSGNGAHQDDEWVDIQGLVDYYEILKRFLLKVDADFRKDLEN